MKVLILYYTKTGHTLEAANATADGIRSAGSEAELINVNDFTADRLANYDALIVGSPCWGGSLSKKMGIAGPVKKALKTLGPGALKDKRCGGFAVHAGNGAENTVRSIGNILMEKGCENYRPGPVAVAGVPLSLWKGPSVSTEDQEHFKSFGIEFVTL